jgi:hypothetical protein
MNAKKQNVAVSVSFKRFGDAYDALRHGAAAQVSSGSWLCKNPSGKQAPLAR